MEPASADRNWVWRYFGYAWQTCNVVLRLGVADLIGTWKRQGGHISNFTSGDVIITFSSLITSSQRKTKYKIDKNKINLLLEKHLLTGEGHLYFSSYHFYCLSFSLYFLLPLKKENLRKKGGSRGENPPQTPPIWT